MKSPFIIFASVLPLVLLAGCVSAPTGPSVMALPGTGKNFDQFRYDDAECRQYALSQSGGATANQAAVDAGVRSAAVGTVVGAVAGAVGAAARTVADASSSATQIRVIVEFMDITFLSIRPSSGSGTARSLA